MSCTSVSAMKPSLTFIVYALTESFFVFYLVTGQTVTIDGPAIAVLGDSVQFKCTVSGFGSSHSVLFQRGTGTDAVVICSVGADCTQFIGKYKCYCGSEETGLFYANITSISRDDGHEEWKCQYSSSTSNGISVDVHYAPSVNLPNMINVTENHRLSLNCSKNTIPGNPSLTSYSWTGPGDFNMNGTLLERNVTRTQGGQFTCTAINTVELSDSADVNINVQYPPRNSPLPMKVNVTENTSPDIDCSSNITLGNPPDTIYHWTGPGGYNETGAVLYRNISRTQEGQYTCTSTNTAGLSDTDSLNITVLYAPTIHLPNSQDVTENTSPDVDCSSNVTYGIPPGSSYIWTGPDHYSKTGTLLDRNISRTQGGEYICTATNTAGLSGTATININVLYAPLVNIPGELSVVEYTSPALDCSKNITLGNPENTSYEWTGPDEYNASGAVLDRNITRTQAGQYSCTANNTAGMSDTAHANISVAFLNALNLAIYPSEVNETERFEIFCNVTSDPIATMTIMNIDNGTIIVDEEATNDLNYVVKSARCLHNGSFRCITFNGQIEKTVTTSLSVLCSPRHDFRKSLKQAFHRSINETVTMTADAIANPPPTFSWWRYTDDQLQPISGHTVHTEYSTRLQTSLQMTVTHARDYGTYAAKMENDIGEDIILYTLSSITVPLPPDEVRVVNISASVVTLQWNSNNNGGSEQTFSLDYRREDTDWTSWKAGIPDPGKGKVMETGITRLVQNTQYLLQVYAVNIYGSSIKVTSVTRTANDTGSIVHPSQTVTEDRLGQGIGIGFGITLPFIIVLSVIIAMQCRQQTPIGTGFSPIFQIQQTVQIGQNTGDTDSGTIPRDRTNMALDDSSRETTYYEDLEDYPSNTYIELDTVATKTTAKLGYTDSGTIPRDKTDKNLGDSSRGTNYYEDLQNPPSNTYIELNTVAKKRKEELVPVYEEAFPVKRDVF